MAASTLLLAGSPRAASESRSCSWTAHRRDRDYAAEAGRSAESAATDLGLVRRILAAYRRTFSIEAYGNGLWRKFFERRHGSLHETLMNGTVGDAARVLRDPASSDLYYGFDDVFAANTKLRLADARAVTGYAATCKAQLVALAEALGVERIDNPELYSVTRTRSGPATDALLQGLDARLGTRVNFPNPFPNEFGLATDRGIAAYRAIHALYQAFRIRELAPSRVLEIGAGLGRTALYSEALGVRDYTIVDLPFTNVSQAYFLGRVLGANRVVLDGEPYRAGAIRILSPATFLQGAERYELFVNVDSLVELPPDVARPYYDAFRRRGRQLLSINHESESDTVYGSLRDLRHTRHPYWMRRGYVEEVYSLRS